MARSAKKAGFEVVITGKNHIKWVAPNGARYISALTFGDPRRIKSLRKFLLTNGVEL